MVNTRANEMFHQLTRAGGPLDYGPERSRLLVRVQRALAAGRPVTTEEMARYLADLGLTLEEADAFLRTVTERDEDDNIVGAMGLSLNETPHRLALDGTSLWAWCAEDTLVFPLVLDQSVTVESISPLTGELTWLRLSPTRIEEVIPADAVLSLPMVDPTEADMSSVDAIWNTFCHHSFFFPSRTEAEQWAAGRENIEILPVEEGFAIGRELATRILAYGSCTTDHG